MGHLDRLLAFDEHPATMACALTYRDFPLYPLVRHMLHQAALEELNEHSHPATRPPTGMALLRYLGWAFRRRPSLVAGQERPVLIYCTDAATIPSKDGYVNRLGEYFARQYPQITTLLERSHEFRFKVPRTYPVYYSDWVKIRATAWARLTPVSRRDRAAIDAFVEHVRRDYPHSFRDPRFIERLREKLLMHARRIKAMDRSYRRLFAAVRPRIILVEAGSYGGDDAVLIRAAKDLGIRTAEHQHGMIHGEHPAYNYAIRGVSASYRLYLPDDFLCYGEFWARQVRLPERIVCIGNPFLLEQKARCFAPSRRRGTRILVTSSGINPPLIREVALQLQSALGAEGYAVSFRYHPLEDRLARERYRGIEEAGIAIDRGNIHEALSAADILVGEWSTVLFEAVAFSCKVLALSSPVLEANRLAALFPVVRDGAEAIARIRRGDLAMPSIDELWGSDWKGRYRDYLLEWYRPDAASS